MSDPVLVDTKGMKCPLPVLKARKALKALDPGAVKDFEHFCKVTGASLVALTEETGGVLVFTLRKPG